MNTWQALKQLRYKLRARTWAGTGSVVFPEESILITSAPTAESLSAHRVPICVIRAQDGQVDPDTEGEQRDYLRRNIGVTLISSIAGDAGTGENSIIGANRTGGATVSENRGLLELEEELFEAAKSLGEVDGLSIQFVSSGASEIQPVEGLGHVSFADYQFALFCTASRFYHPGRELAATVAGGGSSVVSWALPPDRYDRYKMVLRRASGSTAPASATAGTGVTLGSDLATSVTDTPGVGTWSYALFAAYDETYEERQGGAPTTAERYSAAATVTVTLT